MDSDISYCRSFPEDTWGSTFHEISCLSAGANIFACHTDISDVEKIATELSTIVLNQSWILDLDHRAKRAYETTATETAKSLIKVFQTTRTLENKVASEFGELMVSMGSSKALEVVFKHKCIPLAEIWKPKILGNEGFDFHTVCPSKMINFGEAKFSATANPYGGLSGSKTGAGGQADGFILKQKHLMDGVHLGHLAGEDAAMNLDKDLFGVVLAFSINSSNPLAILKNALEHSTTYEHLKKATNIYIVGVSYELKAD